MPPKPSHYQNRNHVHLPTVPALLLPDEIAPEVESQLSLHSLDSGPVEAESHRGPSYQQRPQLQHSDSSFYDHPEKGGTDNEDRHQTVGNTKKRDILFAAAVVFAPILTISLLLLGFTFDRTARLRFESDADINNDNDSLPSVQNPSLSYYYTDIDSTSYVLVGSWASNIALGLFTPFMLLFSFLVAWTASSESNAEVSHIMHELLKGSQGAGLWRWLKHLSQNAFSYGRVRKPDSRSLYVAGVGFLSAFLMR